MSIEFIPTPAIAWSLASAAELPLALVALSHGPWKVRAPGRRFIVAAGIATGSWAVLMCVLNSSDAIGVASGALLLATALLAGFTLWTLVAWGFTTSMLLALARAGRPIALDEWIAEYTGGKPLATFSRDRLGLLLRFGFAELREDRLAITPARGLRVARAIGMLRRAYGLPK